MKHSKIVIFGQYKTGTTALFYRIKNSLPSNTRTYFEQNEYLYEEEDKDRYVLSKVILGRPEVINYESFSGFEKKIFITRDPRDWVVSGTLFVIQQIPNLYKDPVKLKSVLEILKQKEKNPSSISLIHLIDTIYKSIPGQSINDVKEWIKWLHPWLFVFEAQLDDYILLRYEDFVCNRIKKLKQYLELSLNKNTEIAEEHDHVIRTKSFGDWANWFTQKDIDFFKPLFKEYIKRYNYSQDWILNCKQQIRPEYCSQYIEYIVLKRKGI